MTELKNPQISDDELIFISKHYAFSGSQLIFIVNQIRLQGEVFFTDLMQLSSLGLPVKDFWQMLRSDSEIVIGTETTPKSKIKDSIPIFQLERMLLGLKENLL